MKKTVKKWFALLCVMAVVVSGVNMTMVAKAEEAEKTCIGGTTITVNCKQTDVVTFTSDDTGLAYNQTGYSSVSFGGITSYSVSFSILFSVTGNHTLTTLVNGIEKETKQYEVFASHSWGEGQVTKEANCKQEGERTFTCANCGQTRKETIAKTDHNYVETSKTAATCQKDGQVVYMCSVCHDKKTETIAKIPHNYEKKVLEEATCTENGESADVCTLCGDTQNKTVIPKTGHSWGEWKVTEKATIFDSGEEQRVCSACGDIDGRDIKKLPSSVTLAKKSLKIKVGKKTTIKIKKKTSGDSVKSFASSKKSVATVTKVGKITAKKKGTTTITLTMKSGCKAVCKVTVK